MKQVLFIALFLFGIATASLFPDGEKFTSGLITIDQSTGDRLFYWLFDSRSDPRNDPLVLWLTGGPGCSSGLACLKEMGPYQMPFGESKLKIIKEGWNDKANLLFVDQPIGTGFSSGEYSHYCTDEKCVSKDFFLFFKGFLQQFPQYANRPFYITGESYAGHYIPAIAAYLKAQQYQDPKLGINLASVAIGNGLTDPYYQYPAYAEYAKEKKIVTESQYEKMKKELKVCQDLIKKGSSFASMTCNSGSNLAMSYYKQNTGKTLNHYNYKEPCVGSLCYDFSNVEKFFNDASVQTDLNVKSEHKTWQSCDNTVHSKMQGDWMNNLTPEVKYLLANDVDVLIYAGELDYICNYLGNKIWTENLDWAYKADYVKQPDEEWPLKDGKYICSKNLGEISYKKGAYGKVKRFKNFSFLQVFEAGHMVPMDKPEAGMIMLDEFFHKLLANKKQYYKAEF